MTRSCVGQAKQSQLGRRYANLGATASPRDDRTQVKLTQGIRDSGDVEMSLLVRASRNLPIVLLTNEYKRILERRLQVVGGQLPSGNLFVMRLERTYRNGLGRTDGIWLLAGRKDDPALRAMLEKFRWACSPSAYGAHANLSISPNMSLGGLVAAPI